MNQLELVTVSTPQLFELIKRGLKEQLTQLKNELKEKLEERLLTRQETAEYLSISISTLSNWTANKTITSYGIGGRVYYKLSDIERALVKLS